MVIYSNHKIYYEWFTLMRKFYFLVQILFLWMQMIKTPSQFGFNWVEFVKSFITASCNCMWLKPEHFTFQVLALGNQNGKAFVWDIDDEDPAQAK